ncbi:MAG: hypothetical protein JWQ12_1891 [Glaciihabitans sp.]|nr:hypothetical protein [Glaciihabitans sp.]
MGFIGNLVKLTAMGEEMRDKTDVKARMSEMQTKMDALNASMAASVPQAVDPASEARRVLATATVSAARPTGLMVNFQPSVEIDLLVMLPSGAPMPVSTTVVVSQLNLTKVQPGTRLAVSIDPSEPASVRIDWAS